MKTNNYNKKNYYLSNLTTSTTFCILEDVAAVHFIVTLVNDRLYKQWLSCKTVLLCDIVAILACVNPPSGLHSDEIA